MAIISAIPNVLVAGNDITATQLNTNFQHIVDSVNSYGVASVNGVTPVAGDVTITVAGGASFDAGTRMPFAQASAPTGWVQDTSDNATNRMLRVVNTAGNGVGGSHSPILNNVVPSHTHTITTGTESAGHTHSVSAKNITNPTLAFTINDSGGDGIASADNGGAVTGNFVNYNTGGASAAHTHSGTTNGGSSQTNWTPRYIDMIICTKS